MAVQFLEGLALACEDNGSGLLLVPVSPEADDPGAVARAGVDGFVVYSMPDDDDNFAAVLERPVPVVVCDQPTAVSDVDRVGIDDHAAMVDMARHLAGLGHRRVGVLCMRLSTERNDGFASVGRQENARYEVQRRRLSGLREGFAEAGVDWSTVPVVERFDHSESAGASGAEQLLARHDVTAIACTSDLLALGALRHVRESGRHVPDQVSVTGFDGVPAAERAELTTIRQPTLDKGRAAGELLLDRGDRQRSRTLLLPTELLARATSGPPPGASGRWHFEVLRHPEVLTAVGPTPSASRNPAAQRSTSCSSTCACSRPIRRRASSGSCEAAATIASPTAWRSCGLTRYAPSPSSSAAPVNSESTSAPPPSDRDATYSLATRFMPSR